LKNHSFGDIAKARYRHTKIYDYRAFYGVEKLSISGNPIGEKTKGGIK